MMTLMYFYQKLNFVVTASAFSHYVEYRVYDVVGWQGDGSPIFPREDAEPTTTVEQADVYISGSVKWDGCSNWKFDEQERCMLHGCSRDDVLRFGQILAECHDLTAQLCPNWAN